MPSAPSPSRCAIASRQKLAPEMAEEVIPKNILMIGPTGVGKTEDCPPPCQARQFAILKVEASKFTEVGYVGRDVESMIRDLVEIAIEMVREEKFEDVSDKAELELPKSGCSISFCRRSLHARIPAPLDRRRRLSTATPR